MNIKLVIADYDNTLAPTGEKLPERNREALYELHRRGIPFCLASGKNLYNLKVVEDGWNLTFKQPFVLGMNGAELLDRTRNKVHEYELLSGETIKELCDMMEPFHLNPFVYWQDGMLMDRSDAEAEASCRRNKLKIYLTSELGPVWQKPNAKLIYRVEEEMVPAVRKFVEGHQSDKWVLVQTQKTVLEFVHPETSKGHTLRRICEMENISLDEVMAFGDSENDDEMLKICHGICLKDGMEETKKISEDVTDLTCVEGGLGDYLFKHVL
ncbi:MAG: HAD family phosphatase [Erysipelotrichaceae bacterium]|nr:HAD family phosphatase [Erysipelotrichaceae bacterium]